MKAKIGVKKNDFMDRFTEIEITEPVISDIVQALQLAGRDYAKICPALISIVTTFDGKKLPVEEVVNIPFSGLVEISTALFSSLEIDLQKFADTLLNSLKLQTGATETSKK